MYQLYDGIVNSPETELAQNINANQTTIPVKDASKLPAPPNLAVIGRSEDAETILYTGKSGNTLTGVTRGFQGQARTWKAGAPVARRFTEYDWRAIKENFLRYAQQPVVNVKGFGAKGDGVTDDTQAIQAAIDTAYTLQIGTVYFPAGKYLISAPIKIYSNTRYVMDFRPYTSYIRATSDIPYFEKHPSAGSWLSKTTLEGFTLYPNINNNAHLIDISTWSQCVLRRIYIFQAGKGIKADNDGSDVTFEYCIFEHTTNPVEFGGFVGAKFKNCTFIEDYSGTAAAKIRIPQAFFSNNNVRNLRIQFDNCWFERCDLEIDGANVQVNGHVYLSNVVLGPHSVNCEVDVDGDLLTCTIMDLGWNNRILNANGQNCFGAPNLVSKSPTLTTGTNKQVAVSSNTEYLFIASQTSSRSDNNPDPSVIEYYDNTNGAVLYQSGPANTYGYGSTSGEFYTKRRTFSRFTNIALITTPTNCSELRIYSKDTAENSGRVDVFGYPNLLTNGDLKSADFTKAATGGWTVTNASISDPVNGFCTIQGTNAWRIYQQVNNLQPGRTYALIAKWKNNVGKTRLTVQSAKHNVTDGNGILLNLLDNAQTAFSEPDGGYIAIGYFVATESSVYVNLNNYQSSSIDIAWMALIQL